MKLHFRSYAVICLLMLSCTACSQKTFSSIELGVNGLEGKLDSYKSIDAYIFTYRFGSLVSIEYQRNEIPALNEDKWQRIDITGQENMTEYRFKGLQREPVFSEHYRCSVLHAERIEPDAVRISFFNENNTRIVHSYGSHWYEIHRFKGGKLAEITLFGKGEKPFRHYEEFYHKIEYSYPDAQTEEYAYYRENGKPTTFRYTNYQRIRIKRNEAGKMVSLERLSLAGKPTISRIDMVHEYQYDYDREGFLIEERRLYNFYQLFDKMENKLYKIEYSVDSNGLCRMEKFSGDNGQKKVSVKTGASLNKYTYDSAGKMTSVSVWDSENIRIEISGYHVVKYEYNCDGRLSGMSYYNAAYKPVVHYKYGFHKTEIKYNPRAFITEKAYYGTNGKPVNSLVTLAHKEIYQRDINGSITLVRNEGINGEPVRAKGMEYAEYRAINNPDGSVAEFSFFDNDGSPAFEESFRRNHRTVYTYDTNGRIKDWLIYDRENRFVNKTDMSRLAFDDW